MPDWATFCYNPGEKFGLDVLVATTATVALYPDGDTIIQPDAVRMGRKTMNAPTTTEK